ncbi:MAG: thioredoxin domain-containing protein [Deltaproteobacteria bacterium]|nr:thioredoxin domain-containing protein [Deltaproteobacteria bacterium]
MCRWFRRTNFFFIPLVLAFLGFVFFPYSSWGANIPLVNQLADSPSPYLREAATSPVHWQFWGEQAFRLAKKTDRPILLDIGAIWCHWCHVMDEKTYGNPEVAKFINENFIPIKVDRDARPDIDGRFQLIVSALTRHGGWPLTVFMTPSGHAFFGGGTFLPEDSYRRPGFKTLLPRIVEVYQKDKEKLTANAKAIYRTIESNIAGSLQKGPLSQDLVRLIQEDILNRSDPMRGGLKGSRVQFPRAAVLNLAIELVFKEGRTELANLVETTLDAMARGGIRDQLGGGFHRYSTDSIWIVPHFEQMDYVQAQLLRTYAMAYHMTGKPLYREVMEGIIDYVNRTLLDPDEGGFYAHKDADMGPGDDGEYFTWTVEEVKKGLSTQEAKVIIQHFDIGARGEMREEPNRNVLWVAKSPDEIAKGIGISKEKVKELIRAGKRHLLEIRKKRKNPMVDQTRLAGRSALMVTGYLEAYKVLGDEKLKRTALKSLAFIWRSLYRPTEGIYHAFMGGKAYPPYLLNDQVLVSQALLKAFEVTGEIRYVKRAQVLMDLAIQRLWDDKKGGFFDKVPQEGELSALSLPMKIFQDKEMPGPNAVAALVLNRLYDLTNKKIYRKKAEATLEGFAGTLPDYGMFAATYGQALSRHLNHPAQVVIIGAMKNPKTHELWDTALKTFRPGKFVSVYDPQKVDLNTLPPAVQAAAKIGMEDEIPKVYVCVGAICALPTSNPQEAAKLIRTFDRSKEGKKESTEKAADMKDS